MDGDDESASVAPTAAVVTSGRENKDKETVKVVVRCRPFSTKETNEGRKSIITTDTQSGVVGIRCPDNDQIKSFTFDSVYDESTTQRQFYDESGYPLVESIFEGYNGTIFAYGQTGCGKTHTMQGRDQPPELRGVIPHSFDHIFENISADPSKEYMVRASYLEIYNEEIRDLLCDDQKKKLDLKESADGSVYVKDLIEVVVGDVESINKVMAKGFKNRTVGATLMNEGSSRSHSIFTVVVEVSEKIGGEDHFKAGKLNLVDLAGSERQSKTGATGNRLKEGCKINLSLSALGNVISALVDGKGKHIPYRDSKLTRLLQDSLGGNTKTLMVAAISPADYNYDETLSTLRYANRAKNIKNKPIVNEDPKDAKLREYKEEIERLKKMLESQSRGSVTGSLSGVSTPTRPLTPSSTVAAAAERDLQLTREREEIAKYQQEAALMMERARRMMEEAKELQEQQARQPPQSVIAEGGATTPLSPTRPSSVNAADPGSGVETRTPTPPSGDAVNSPKPGSAGRPMTLPPLQLASPRELKPQTPGQPTHAEQSPSQLQPQQPPSQQSSAVKPTAPLVPATPSVVVDPAITRALDEAARVDAEAKAMMARAEQMIKEAERRAKEPPKVKVVKEVVVKEVIPDAHIKEKAELEVFNQTILDQKDRMGKELERTQQAMESYLREKEELNSKLKKIEGQILGGASTRNLHHADGKPLVDTEIALLKQQVEYRRAQIKLKEKAKREAKFEAAQRALTLEKQLIEEELKTAQETAQANLAAARKKESRYKAKLEATRQEIVDLNNEFERERENLLDTIREQTKESKLLEQLVELFLPQNELVKVWERAVWLEDKEEWQLPKIKPRSDFQRLKLPALGLGSPSTVASGGESGGAEVVSDNEDSGSPTIPSTQRSVGSSAGTRARPKPSKPGTSGKASSHHESGLFSGRQEEIGANQISHAAARLLSPDSSRVFPASIRPLKEEPQPQQPETSAPGTSSSKSTKKPKDGRRRSKDGRSADKSPTASSSPDSPRSHQPPVASGESLFAGHDDLLTPLQPEGFHSRDRLASRQGSRQGPRSMDRQIGHSNTSSQSSLGEFDAPPSSRPPREASTPSAGLSTEKPPIPSRGAHSRGGGSGSRGSSIRKHHKEKASVDSDNEAAVEADGVATAAENSPDASLIKKKTGKHKKKRKDKVVAAEEHHDEADLLNDLGSGFFLPRATSPQSPEQ